MPKLSLIYSVFNRTELFKCGLESIAQQNFPLDELEIVIVDDGSTEDIKDFLEFFPELHFKYIRFDHTKHPIWQELNPNGTEEEWYHTQAISANIGIRKATSDFICISQPEMIHAPYNLAKGLELAQHNRQVFAELYLATQKFNDWLKKHDMTTCDYETLYNKAMSFDTEYPFDPPGDHLYWYIHFFPRQQALAIGGVDEEYLRGVYAEDDNFKSRLRMAGTEEIYAGRPDRNIPYNQHYVLGIHQSHLYEKDLYKKQDRNGDMWNRGSQINRQRWSEWCQAPRIQANEGKDWGSFDLITEECEL